MQAPLYRCLLTAKSAHKAVFQSLPKDKLQL